MYEVRRRGQLVYEDLLRELEVIEHSLLTENSSAAMNLMVLEAKIRERFQVMDRQIHQRMDITDDDFDLEPEMSMEEIQALIPRELPAFPVLADLETGRRRKKNLKTAGMAAILAIVTACGVFGLASILQIALAWLA